MAVLVTGAGGFLGGNQVYELASSGREVIGLHRSPLDEGVLRFVAPCADRVRWLQGDITDPETLEIVAALPVDEIVHHAVLTPTLEQERDNPERIVDVNLMGSVKVFELARRLGVRRVIYVSSSGVYGRAQHPRRLVPETQPPELFNTYCITKWASERIAERYSELYGFSVAVARVGAPYGPLERPRFSRPAVGPICRLLDFALSGRTVRVAGLEIARDWTYAADTVRAIRLLLDASVLNYTVYNVSAGVSYTLGQILEVMFRVCGLKWEVVGDRAEADVCLRTENMRGPLDIARLYRDTGFVPEYDLERGISAYWQWALSSLRRS